LRATIQKNQQERFRMQEKTTKPHPPVSTEQGGFRLRKRSVHPDARGRITLGDAVGDAEYRVLVNDAGQILLDPVVTLAVPASEAWLWQHEGVRASMDRALEQAARGEFHDLGSFAEYIELETDEEA
jgi:hypothetical protein